jgi:hypothetical protein
LFQRRHAIARFLASRGIGEFVGSAKNVALLSKHLYLRQDSQDAKMGSCKKEEGAQDGEARWRGLEDSALANPEGEADGISSCRGRVRRTMRLKTAAAT